MLCQLGIQSGRVADIAGVSKNVGVRRDQLLNIEGCVGAAVESRADIDAARRGENGIEQGAFAGNRSALSPGSHAHVLRRLRGGQLAQGRVHFCNQRFAGGLFLERPGHLPRYRTDLIEIHCRRDFQQRPA